MAKTTADVLFERLLAWGVDVIFGLPGDGINGFMEGLRSPSRPIRFVQVRHEEGAAFMACGYAKFTGRLGVCIATSGPGAIHLLNGLYDAKLDGAPVLAITGQTYHDLMGMHYQQKLTSSASSRTSRFSISRSTDRACTFAGRRRMPHRAVEAWRGASDLSQRLAGTDRRGFIGHDGPGPYRGGLEASHRGSPGRNRSRLPPRF